MGFPFPPCPTTPNFVASCFINIAVQGGAVALNYQPVIPQNTAAPGGVPASYALAVGTNAIAIPSGAQNYMIVPPATSTNAKSITATSSASNGVPFVATPILLPVAGQTTIYVQSTAAEAVVIAWF
jgi:hypothetical protein